MEQLNGHLAWTYRWYGAHLRPGYASDGSRTCLRDALLDFMIYNFRDREPTKYGAPVRYYERCMRRHRFERADGFIITTLDIPGMRAILTKIQ